MASKPVQHDPKLTWDGGGEILDESLLDEPPNDSLRQIEHFKLRKTFILFSPQEMETSSAFSAFKTTLSGITLSDCGLTEITFIALINCFSGLKFLRLKNVYILASCGHPVPDLNPHSLEMLYVQCVPGHLPSDFFRGLPKQGLRSDEIVLGYTLRAPGHSFGDLAHDVTCAFGDSVKCLRLPQIPTDSEPFKLDTCRELCELELEISTDPPTLTELDLISSIDSENVDIKKIIINRKFISPVENTFWSHLDDTLTELVERLGDEHILEVELRGDWNGGDWSDDVEAHLPKFVQNGGVIVPTSPGEENDQRD